jgi:hypothetical protein
MVYRPAVATWALWRQPRCVVILILIVEISAVAAPFALTTNATESDVGLATLLASLSIAYSALTCRSERARRALSKTIKPPVHPNLLAAWGLAAAILLPLVLAAFVLVAASLADWPARKITGRASLYRHVYTAASTLLAAVAVHLCLRLQLPCQAGYLAATAAYTLSCVVIIALAVAASGEFRALRVYTRLRSYRLDGLTALIALAQVELHFLHFPVLWLSLPATIALQRRSAQVELRSASAETVDKPMSQEAWAIAAGEVVSALPVAAIIRINSTAPEAVAEIARLQAGCDAIGYVGASGLGILLVDCPALSADALASRVRTALRHHDLEASVAAAAKPRDGYRLDDLLAVCEAELIARDAASRSARPSRPEA